MLIILTGNGKGKTTSALGQALRAVGDGKKVIMYQFIKAPKSKRNPWTTGEDFSWKLLAPKFKLVKGGKGFVGILGDSLPRSTHKKAAYETWEKGKRAIKSGKYDMVIFDELNVALKLKLLPLKDIMPTLRKYKEKTDIMITGRGASPQLIKLADLVSEVKEIKHPYNKGAKSKKGIEY